MPRRVIDIFDLQAEAEAGAIRQMRQIGAGPAILGKRVAGSKTRYTKSKTATSHVQNRHREEKVGLGA